ncbi:MAG: transporter protein [Nevskia sp.]|nr:transporter protein [Nevskia sp.]
MSAVPSHTPAQVSSRPIWRIATAIPGRRNAAVLSCIVLAGIFEGIGIATLLPLIAVIGDDGSKTNKISQLILHALDRVHLPHNPIVLLAIIGGGMLLKGALSLLALRQVGRAVADVGAGMRLGLIDALLKARWSYYVRQPVGRFAGALGDESSRAGDAYDAMTQLFSQLVQATIYLIIAAIASWQLALLSILVSLIMVGSLNRFLLVAKRNARTQNERLKSMLARLTDVLIGIKPMKAMSRQARFGVLFLEDLKVIKRAARRQVFARNTNRSLQEPILALCLTFGIFMALQVLHLQVGEVMVMSLLLAKTVSIVGKAQMELQNVYRSESGYWSVFDAIAEARAQRETAAGKRPPSFERDIEFRDVGFSFGERDIIRHAGFTLAAGEVIALTGPSGAGKTTLVDLLLGLHTPTSGNIFIDGVPLSDIDVIRWRGLTGYVPQELMLFNDSILMNVTLGEAQFSRDDVERALRQAGAWEFVAQLPEGMDSIAGERGTLLSGGQRQRIAVARALVHQPKLLILDEATSALDPVNEHLIVNNVCGLARERGLTVLAISHHQAWMSVADRVLKLKDGHLAVENSAARVRATG